ncbi:tetratricopeptide repeat protein [Pseudoxanthomonas composti]|nr:tetratricopeptide repeat protein [Pseudoxanthomonas composti]
MSAAAAQQRLEQVRQRLRQQPQDFIAWVMLSEAEMDTGNPRAGEAAALRALSLRPDHPEALARLGRARWMLGRIAEASASLRLACQQQPQHPGFWLWLGHVLEDAHDAEGAAEAYRRSHALMPQEAQIAAHRLNWQRKLCDWEGVDALSRQVRDAVRQQQAMVEPFAFLSEEASAAEQLQCARTRAQAVAASVTPLPAARVRDHGALRVGLMSNGFGAHPTGLLIVALLEALAQQGALSLHLFALNAEDGSPIGQRLRRAAQWHDLSAQSHLTAAQAIRAAGIDVLYDLRGWGGGGRPEILAQRPAPVQVNWLAYPGTSGAPWIDHVLADAFVLPPALEAGFSEQVLRLPRAFQPSDTRRLVGQPPSRAALGLPETGVVFCCFNNSYKLNPRSIDRSLAVLAGVPGSVLWLLSGPGQADARLRRHAVAKGIAEDRLVFIDKQPHAHYLALYRHADLFLDTSPYNAHTTASDALWAGCPVLSCPGETYASRVAGSLNHHLGLDALNLPDDAAFVASAIALASQPHALAELRERLARARQDASLFDMVGFADDFARATAEMARQRGWAGA